MQFALKKGGESEHPLGKISFVDLAGSERGADTYDNNRHDLPPTLLHDMNTEQCYVVTELCLKSGIIHII